jgi:delta-aminolevulinic acid dehydratase/porphobilinogen synthase
MQDKTHLVDDVTGHRRMRRNRKADWTRRLVLENRLTVDDLIWPIFVVPGTGIVEPIAAMPGVNRMSVDKAVEAAREAADLGIPALATFPNVEMDLRDQTGSPTSRSTPSPVTAMTASCVTERSSMTKQSTRSSRPPSCRRMPDPISLRLRT